MHKILLLGCVLIIGGTAFVVVSPTADRNVETPSGPNSSHSPANPHGQSPLAGFMSSLDTAAVQRCLAQHRSGRPIDTQDLMQCGDFGLYAEHLSMPERQAFTHFRSIIKRSKSVDTVRMQLQTQTNLVTPQVQTR